MFTNCRILPCNLSRMLRCSSFYVVLPFFSVNFLQGVMPGLITSYVGNIRERDKAQSRLRQVLSKKKEIVGGKIMKRTLVLSILLIAIFSISLLAHASSEPWKEFDFEGRTVRIDFRFWDISPFGERGDYDWRNPDPRMQAHIEEVEEMFNVKLEFPAYTGHANLMNVYGPDIIAGDLTASAFSADVARSTRSLLPLAMGGYLHPLDDILDEDYYNSLPISYRSKSGLDVKGRMYGFDDTTALIEPVGILWNKDFFEEEGLPDLYELYLNNEWTWDVFEELVTGITRDTTGDGENDYFGLNIFWPRSQMLAILMYTNNATLTNLVDGRYEVAFDSPEAIETYELWQRLWNSNSVIARSRDGVSIAAMQYAPPPVLQFEQFQALDDLFGWVPLPLGPSGTEYVFPYWNRHMQVIPITEPNPRGIIEIVSALRQLTAPYKPMSLEEWEQENWMHWGGFMADRDSLRLWQLAAENRTHVDNRAFILDNGLGSAIDQIITEDVSVASTIAAVVPELQSQLDELFND